jgi:hypothetical protein
MLQAVAVKNMPKLQSLGAGKRCVLIGSCGYPKTLGAPTPLLVFPLLQDHGGFLGSPMIGNYFWLDNPKMHMVCVSYLSTTSTTSAQTFIQIAIYIYIHIYILY